MSQESESFPFYVSEYERRFDTKGRISIPDAWLNLPGNETEYFLAWFEPSERILRVYPAQFLRFLQLHTETSRESDREAKTRQRQLLRSARYLRMDPQHRVRIDDELAQELGFSERVVLQGEGRSFCIDAPERAAERRGELHEGSFYEALKEVEDLR